MTGERLSYLLRLLGVSGKTAADQIGVDYSTLSKWRRGKRILKYSSPYAKALAAWALTCPSECESGAVHALLYETFPDLTDAEPDRLVNALCLWLTMPEKTADVSTPDEFQHIFEVPLQTSIGLENLFDAQNQIFHMLSSLPPGRPLPSPTAVLWIGVRLTKRCSKTESVLTWRLWPAGITCGSSTTSPAPTILGS